MRYEVRIERTYSAPVHRVWSALTDPVALSKWLMPNDFEPRLGHRFRFQGKPMPGWRGFVECEVTELEPPRRLAYTWLGDADWQAPTVVRWTLEPHADGTLLRLEHTNFQDPWGRELHTIFSQGWNKMLEVRLTELLVAEASGHVTRA